MDPKMAPEFDPQKWGRKMAPKRGAQYFFWSHKNLQEIKTLFQILGLPFGCHFWTPFWG